MIIKIIYKISHFSFKNHHSQTPPSNYYNDVQKASYKNV